MYDFTNYFTTSIKHTLNWTGIYYLVFHYNKNLELMGKIYHVLRVIIHLIELFFSLNKRPRCARH